MTERQWRDHASIQGSGARARIVARRQLEEWQSRVHKPETRARIRRWSRWETVSFWMLLAGMVCVFIGAPVLGIGFAIWRASEDSAPSWMWGLFGSIGAACALLLTGAALGTHAKDRRLTALYADGQVSVGRLDDVILHPGGGEDQNTYEFLISAEQSGAAASPSARLHRRLYWGEDDSWGAGPERWIGRTIRIRHNTTDPDDLYDVRFDGWADDRVPDRHGTPHRTQGPEE